MRHFLSIHQYKCTMRRCIHTTSLGILLSYSVAFGMGEIKDVTKTFWWWRWSRKGRLAPASNLRTGNWGWFWSSCFEIRFTTCHTQERVQRPGLYDPGRIRFSATWAIRPRSYKILFPNLCSFAIHRTLPSQIATPHAAKAWTWCCCWATGLAGGRSLAWWLESETGWSTTATTCHTD